MVHSLSPLEGTLRLTFQGSDELLPLSYVGWVVRPDTEVRPLDLAATAAAHTLGSAASSQPAAVPPRETGDTQAAAVPQDAPSELHQRLSWSARRQRDVYGYLIYRADRPDGPFVRINAEVVRTAAGEEGVGRYTFVDVDVRPGVTYYYYLDILATNGMKQRFSGVQSRHVADGGGN